jgi:hypothetical protein
MNLTLPQKLGLAIALLGFLATASTQLTDILSPFGSVAPVIVKEVVSISSVLSGALGIFLATVTSQSSAVKAVQDMQGVTSIRVNALANPTLAALAVDPANPKIDAVPGAAAAVAKIAKGV